MIYPHKTRLLQTPPLKRSLFAATASLIGYGGWAFFVNQSAGIEMGLRAAALQGGYSFLLTLSAALVTEKLHQSLPARHSRWLTVAATSAVVGAVAFGIHYLNGTPHILVTILPGIVIGALFTTMYVVVLEQVSPITHNHNHTHTHRETG